MTIYLRVIKTSCLKAGLVLHTRQLKEDNERNIESVKEAQWVGEDLSVNIFVTPVIVYTSLLLL